MSTPIRAPLWITNSASGNHLLSEQIDQQHGRVAVRAVTTQADGTSKKLAVWAATLADTALTATRTLVHRLRHQRAPTLQCAPPPFRTTLNLAIA